jgi:hypothetical protein
MRDDEALVTIATYDAVWKALMAKGVLDAAGIRAVVPEEMERWSANPIASMGTLQVLEGDRDRALAELQRRSEQARSD